MDNDEEDFYDSRPASRNSLTQPLLTADDDTYNVNNSDSEVSISVGPTFLQRNVKLAKICILITVILERASYYGLIGNLVFFLNAYLEYSNSKSAQFSLTFSGLAWITCFVGGVLGDGFLGRFKTIVTGLVLYIFGFILLTTLTCVKSLYQYDNKSVPYLLFTLFVISLGEGCFKSNVSSFGADQLQSVSEIEMRKFFNFFYWSMNIGSFLGFSLLTWIQQQYDFRIGYMVPTCLLLLALICFNIPRTKHYHVKIPQQKLVLKILKMIHNARKNKRPSSSFDTCSPISHWLDRSKVKYGGNFLDVDVEDAKQLFTVLPIFAFTIIYCTIYYQVSSSFLIQGMHMRLINFGSNTMQVPPAWFMVFNIIAVLICVPLIDKYVYPCLDRLSTRAPFFLRIGIGMVLATFAMVSAGTVEWFRLHEETFITNELKYVNITARNMDILYQLPQYILMGLSEIFVLITGLEFAYCQAPKTMQSFATCLFFIANGIGAFCGVIFMKIGNTLNFNIIDTRAPVNQLVPKLDGNLHYFFYFLAGLNSLNTLAFIVYALKKTSKKRKKRVEDDINAFIKDSLGASLRNSPS